MIVPFASLPAHLEGNLEETIYIMGNGPSAFLIPECLEAKGINYDLSGTSAIVLQSRYPNFYWYEPHFLENGEGFKLTTPASASSYGLGMILHHEWTKEVSDDNVGVVIPNPQFPANGLGYMDVTVHKKTLVPPWFFINEISDEEITKGLKEWRRAPNREDVVLNFRGSVIRQLSCAFALGYRNIYIGGLDPSVAGYWYSDRENRDRHMKQSVLSRCARVCQSYQIALPRVAVAAPQESSLASPKNTFYDFDRSILIVLLILCRLYPSINAYLLADDSIISDIIRSELGTVKPKNLKILNNEDLDSTNY